MTSTPARVVFAEHGARYLPLWALAAEHDRSAGEFCRQVLALGEHARFAGTPDDISRQLRTWFDAGAVDGFQVILGNDFDALCDQVVPALRAPS